MSLLLNVNLFLAIGTTTENVILAYFIKYRLLHGLSLSFLNIHYPAGNYMFKVNNRNCRTRCEICSNLTIKHLNDAYGVKRKWPLFGPHLR